MMKYWRNWSWLVYPILTFVLIVTSSGSVFSGGFWQSLTSRQNEVEANGVLVANLKSKLIRLQSTTAATEADNLSFLLSVEPAVKPLSPLVNGLQQTAYLSGSPLLSFRGSAGTIGASESAVIMDDTKLSISASFTVTSPAQLLNLLSLIENSLPLVKIMSVNYSNQTAEMVVEAFWQGLPSLVNQADLELPDPSTRILKLRQDLSSFTSAAPSATISGVPISTTPF